MSERRDDDLGATLTFDLSRPGRIGCALPPLDVPEASLPPAGLLRDDLPLPELSQLDVVRYFTALSTRNYSIDTGFYPLGSCSMKYNPKVNEDVAGLAGFAQLHPMQAGATAQGALALLSGLQRLLAEITGMDDASLAPAAGAHGELAGILIASAYHRANGGGGRRRVLVPDSAHGTNPATAAMAGFEVAPEAIPQGLLRVEWPGRLQRLGPGRLSHRLPPGAELWLDGGHNPGAGEALAATLRAWARNDRARGAPPPLYLVVGMLSSKRPTDFLAPLAPLAAGAFGIAIPDEGASLSAEEVTAGARAAGLAARPADSFEQALEAIAKACAGAAPPRVLICGSLYLAGKVLASEGFEVVTPRAGTSRAPAA